MIAVLTCRPLSLVLIPRIPVAGIFPSPCKRNASSTASMHSGNVSSRSTSLRATKSVDSVCIRCSDKILDVIAGLRFKRSFTLSENPSAGFSFERDGAVLTKEPRAFANANDGSIVFLEKLKDPFLLCFAHMCGVWIWVLKMRTDLKRHQSERVE